jgi:gamma-glutamylcyclotransferase (GGCT)/AIG2-like uncharacterized protein YtfP
VSNLLFVYGTLRRRSRHPMARQLAERADYRGAATIAGRLYDLGRYPGLLEPAAAGDVVQGDLYELGDDPATLQAMDAYENLESPRPAFFERQLATVRCADGRSCEAWVYYFRGIVRDEQRVASGCYDVNFISEDDGERGALAP